MRFGLPAAAGVVALLACDPLAPPSAARTGGPGRTLVRVVSWNVHDLFDSEDRLAAPGALDEVPAAADVEAKLGALAAVLVRLDADLVFLQEVENDRVLAALADRAGYGEARLVEGADPRGIDVAALSRLPVEAYLSHAEDQDPAGARLWPRDCVEVHARAGASRLVLVGTHASSRLSDPDGARRALQAARLRELADGLRALHPAAVVLAGGDLNDPPDAPSMFPLAGDGRWVDVLPPDAATWTGAAGSARLDALLVARRDLPLALSGWVADGEDVRRASDHLPVVLDLALP
jgi:endonuclease/exonuclease/phosphatase family metal-dependent hydrolase